MMKSCIILLRICINLKMLQVFVFAINPFELQAGFGDYVYIRGKYFLKQGISSQRDNIVEESEEDNFTIPASYLFLQCTNHFEQPSKPGKYCQQDWNQRYWLNSEHYEPGGPIFFLFGGEGNAEGFVELGKWQDYMKKYKALGACLEHRFYGQSFPTLNTSAESFGLLTSQQALSDAAKFILWLKSNYSQSSLQTAKVVVFGGSYPGNLAAWFRQKYPHIANVAVASSAPLEAKFDFPGYFKTVSKVIYQSDPICYWNIFETFQCMQGIIRGERCQKSNVTSSQELLNILHQCYPYNFSLDLQIQTFFHDQGSKWASNYLGHSIAKKCATLKLQSTTFDVLKNYGNFLVKMGMTNLDCPEQNSKLPSKSPPPLKVVDEEGDEVVGLLKSDDESEGVRNARSWIWQTCNEFGFFQVADTNMKLFTDEWNTSLDVQRCQKIFPDANFTRGSIKSRIDQTNAYYKGKHYNGTCTIFVNGGWDPWNSLGIKFKHETSLLNTVIFIPEAEHCQDMKINDGNASVKVCEAQEKIQKQIGEYLANPKC